MYSIRETFLFQTEIYTFRIFICSSCCFFFLSSLWGSVCCCFCCCFVFFCHEEHEDILLSWKIILFRIFRFFGSEESVWSEITNPFLGSPRKTHPYCWFYSLDSKRVLTFPSKLFLDSPQISVSFNVQDAGRVLNPKTVLSFAQQNTPPLQANWQQWTQWN